MQQRTSKISQPDCSEMVCVSLNHELEAEHSHIDQKTNQGFGSSSSLETAALVMTKVVVLTSALPSEKCL